MEHDDSGRTRFLPHIFSPDMGHLVSDHSDNVVDPTVQHKTHSLNVTLSHDKRFYHVEKCKMSHPLALPIRFAEARLSGIVSQVPHGKFCCAFIHRAVAKLARGICGFPAGASNVRLHH